MDVPYECTPSWREAFALQYVGVEGKLNRVVLLGRTVVIGAFFASAGPNIAGDVTAAALWEQALRARKSAWPMAL
jgi:hypothetical protein